MRSALALACAALLGAGCSTLSGGGAVPVTAPPAGQAGAGESPWPVKTRYVLDLWLHGYAMVQRDTTQVPYFRRGYRDAMVVAKNSRNLTTQLDANAEELKRGLAGSPGLIGGQFLALQERSWEELSNDIAIFLKADGDPHAVKDKAEQAMVAAFAQSYRSKADREWLRLFASSLADEHTRFYEQYWNDRQRDLRPVLASVDSLFAHRYLSRLHGYLNNSQLESGEIFLSLPLDGEGRTITSGQHSVAVTFPATADSSIEAVYGFVHEVAGVVASQAVSDNTTPNDKRLGVAARYESPAAVRGGAMLLRRAIPDVLTGYERYYLRAAGAPASGADVEGAFVRAFPLPQAILDAIDRQLNVVLGGI
jgi:hypothetical protein